MTNEAREALKKALDAAGIQMSFDSCGCCNGVRLNAKLPDGTVIEDEFDANFSNMKDETK